jgi:hypothetical protein
MKSILVGLFLNDCGGLARALEGRVTPKRPPGPPMTLGNTRLQVLAALGWFTCCRRKNDTAFQSFWSPIKVHLAIQRAQHVVDHSRSKASA